MLKKVTIHPCIKLPHIHYWISPWLKYFSARGFLDFPIMVSCSLWSPVALAHVSIVTLSLHPLYPGAVFSLRDASVLLGRAFQQRPVSSQLHTWFKVSCFFSIILASCFLKSPTQSVSALIFSPWIESWRIPWCDLNSLAIQCLL